MRHGPRCPQRRRPPAGSPGQPARHRRSPVRPPALRREPGRAGALRPGRARQAGPGRLPRLAGATQPGRGPGRSAIPASALRASGCGTPAGSAASDTLRACYGHAVRGYARLPQATWPPPATGGGRLGARPACTGSFRRLSRCPHAMMTGHLPGCKRHGAGPGLGKRLLKLRECRRNGNATTRCLLPGRWRRRLAMRSPVPLGPEVEVPVGAVAVDNL
ncbi:MAG: hypothetical protein DCC58_09035 [Chloroflexi bacterium]|nr:MAG: hypothetical protein DCC58_09035 [Chloroflexota bacterium]